jgi:hypothetical protein
MTKMFKNGNRTHEMLEKMGIEPMNLFKNGNRTHDMLSL